MDDRRALAGMPTLCGRPSMPKPCERMRWFRRRCASSPCGKGPTAAESHRFGVETDGNWHSFHSARFSVSKRRWGGLRSMPELEKAILAVVTSPSRPKASVITPLFESDGRHDAKCH